MRNFSSVEPPANATAWQTAPLPGMLPQGPHQVKTERRFIVSSRLKMRNILLTPEVSCTSQFRKDINNQLF